MVECGYIPKATTNRFLMASKLAESTGANLIVCACTSMTPLMDYVRPFLEVPMILIDDEMHRCAPSMGNRVTIFASAETAVEPTIQKYLDHVRQQNAGDKTIQVVTCPSAHIHMRTGNMDEHDRIVLEAATNIHDSDLVILAQYSLTHLTQPIEAICGCKVIGSGEYCIREIARILEEEIVTA
jgi:Asp/Glu/hydantoin racemase